MWVFNDYILISSCSLIPSLNFLALYSNWQASLLVLEVYFRKHILYSMPANFNI